MSRRFAEVAPRRAANDVGVARDGAAEAILEDEARDRWRAAPRVLWKGPDGGRMWVDAVCEGCGCWILFGPSASEEERRRPTCGSYPFAARGVA